MHTMKPIQLPHPTTHLVLRCAVDISCYRGFVDGTLSMTAMLVIITSYADHETKLLAVPALPSLCCP